MRASFHHATHSVSSRNASVVAIENQAFFIAANRAGSDGPFKFLGHSRIISPMGDVVAAASTFETMLLADVDPDLVRKVRDRFPFLSDRRS